MPTSNDKPKKTDEFSELGKTIGNFLLEYSIPFFIAMSTWYFLSSLFRIYRLNIYLFYALFAIVVPGITVFGSRLIAWIIEWSKQSVNKPSKHPESKGRHLMKAILGLVFTAVLTVVTGWVPLHGRETLLNMLMNRMMYGSEYPFISKIGDVIIISGTDTKVTGVNTLKSIHSTKSLDELFRVFVEDHQSINDYGTYSALSGAIASFPESRGKLLEMFFQSDEFASDLPRGVTPGLYDRHFTQAFSNLRDEIKKNILDTQKRDEQLFIIDDIELQLQTALLNMEGQEFIPEGGDPTLDFVLDTFLQMKIAQNDKEIYFLARNIAVDPTYAVGTRLRAIDLWARLGTADDFEQLILLLDCNDEQIRQAALEAITTIHRKIRPKSAGNSNE